MDKTELERARGVQQARPTQAQRGLAPSKIQQIEDPCEHLRRRWVQLNNELRRVTDAYEVTERRIQERERGGVQIPCEVMGRREFDGRRTRTFYRNSHDPEECRREHVRVLRELHANREHLRARIAELQPQVDEARLRYEQCRTHTHPDPRHRRSPSPPG